MVRAILDDTLFSDSDAAPTLDAGLRGAANLANQEERRVTVGTIADRSTGPRRTPRKSVIVVLPDNHMVSPEAVADGLPKTEDHELVDVIIACAGQPANLAAIARVGRDVQVLLAPAGTSREDLRELAIRQAPGDIITMLSSAAVPIATREFEMLGTA
jgi:hypothetical protein